MFLFTTTNVLNTLKDSTGKDLLNDIKDGIHVFRVGTFKKDNVKSIYKAEAVDASNAKVTIDLSAVTGATKGDNFRLALYIGLTQASQNSKYANDFQYKGKPFSIDFLWQDDAATTAEKLAKTIKKYGVLVYTEDQLKISQKGTCVTITAIDEYQRFRQVSIQKLDPDANLFNGVYKDVLTLEDIPVVKTQDEVTDAAAGIFKGQEGFGTYSYILHNLKLPTHPHTVAFGLGQDQNPIIGAKYNLYTIHYCVERGVLGMNAVGDTVTSVTTHVFFVNQAVASDFEKALAKIGTVTDVPSKD